MSNLIANEFTIGDRVELEPHLDRWMMGDRYGEVTSVNPDEYNESFDTISVKLDKSEKTLNFHPTNLVII